MPLHKLPRGAALPVLENRIVQQVDGPLDQAGVIFADARVLGIKRGNSFGNS